MSKQKLPKNHHFVPQVYLRGFADNEERMWVYDKKGNEEDKFRQQKVKATGFEKYFYRFKTNTGDQDTLEPLFNVVETRLPECINSLSERKQLTDLERETLSLFLCIQWFRTPAFKENFLGMEEEATKAVFEKIAHFPKEVITNTLTKGKKITENELDSLIKTMKQKNFRIVYSNEYWIRSMLKLFEDIYPFFTGFNIEIKHAENKCAFITSDNPFMLVPGTKQPSFMGLGLTTPLAKKLLPLRGDLLVILHDLSQSPKIIHNEVDKYFCKDINRRTFGHASRFVYSAAKSKLEKTLHDNPSVAKPRGTTFSVS